MCPWRLRLTGTVHARNPGSAGSDLSRFAQVPGLLYVLFLNSYRSSCQTWLALYMVERIKIIPVTLGAHSNTLVKKILIRQFDLIGQCKSKTNQAHIIRLRIYRWNRNDHRRRERPKKDPKCKKKEPKHQK